VTARPTLAEALARAEELETRVALLEDKLRGLFRGIALVTEHAGLPSEPFREAAAATAGRGLTKAERIERLGLSVVGGGEAS
jgi:hypothetical protein